MKKVKVIILILATLILPMAFLPSVLAEPIPNDTIDGLVTTNIDDLDSDVENLDTTIEAETIYENSVFMFGKVVDLNGVYTKNIYVAGEKINISGVINGDIYAFANILEISDDAEIDGTITLNQDAEIIGDSTKIMFSTYDINFDLSQVFGSSDFSSKIFSTSVVILSTIILAVLLILIAPKLFQKLNKKIAKYDVKKIFIDILFGLVFLVTTPLIFVMLFFTTVGVPVGIIILLAYIIVLMSALVFSGYYIGKMICKKVETKKEMISAAVLGIAAIKIVSLIPYIGAFVEFIALLFGIGLMIRMMRK